MDKRTLNEYAVKVIKRAKMTEVVMGVQDEE